MESNNLKRIAAGLIVAAGLVAAPLMRQEGRVEEASRPVPGDRCTYGYGSTYHLDGSPVKCGEKIDRTEAKNLLIYKVENEYEAGINKCAGDIPMLDREKGVLVEIAYQNGVTNACNYDIVKLFRAGDYKAGCESIPKQLDTIKALKGVHCSLPENRHRKDGCNGLMNRREDQMLRCLGLKEFK